MSNERHLVSRNKREGWYAGKDGWSRGQHHRTRERWKTLRWPGHIPSGHVVFLSREAKAFARQLGAAVRSNYRPASPFPPFKPMKLDLIWIDEAGIVPPVPVSQLQNITHWRIEP